MKKINVKSVALVAMLALLSISCTKKDLVGSEEEAKKNNEEFLLLTQYGAYSAAADLLVFDPATYQLGVSKSENSTKIISDDLSKCVKVTMSQAPAEGVSVMAEISAEGIDALSQIEELELEVVKVEGDKLWLWSSDELVGLVMYWE